MNAEKRAFIPSIQATEETIKRRFGKGHIYLGVDAKNELAGTLALRFANFAEDFADFCKRNPTFSEYAERGNEKDANAVFVYSIGIIPQYRNAASARKLLQGALEIARQKDMEYFVGDARIPSYNGSSNLPYEQFSRNEKLHKAVNNYFRTGIMPSRDLIKKDPVAGFYLNVFPAVHILGITDENFWKDDAPCGGHMIIGSLKLDELTSK